MACASLPQAYDPPRPMPKVYIKTYGCQMNERDTEQVSQMFVERGYTMTRTENVVGRGVMEEIRDT